jgi:hypothetical protein
MDWGLPTIPPEWREYFRDYVREASDWALISEFIAAGANAAAIMTLWPKPYLLYPVMALIGRTKDFLRSGAETIDAKKLAQSVPGKPLPTIGTQAPLVNKETGDSFPGFASNNHVVIIGSTSSGKTTNTITMLLKPQLFSQFDCFVYTASSLSEGKINEVRQAALYNLQVEQSKDAENAFVYFKETQVNDSINFLSTQRREAKKLAFFDDMQIAAEKDMGKIAGFIHQAKNADVQMIVSLHRAFGSKEEIKIREACRYYILYNANEDVFNRLLGLKTGNSLWKKYSLIEEKFDRIIIYDKEERKSYYGTHKYLQFDPLIEKGATNKKDLTYL